MRVVVDTSVWSEYFRRKLPQNTEHVEVLKRLVLQDRAVVLGIVQQEILSGVREDGRFEVLLNAISGFKPLLATEADHILAARFYNICRRRGVQGSFGDLLICAQSFNNRMGLLSSDKDFQYYQTLLPIKLNPVN